jgi:broad specificity phosphatase PhoE
MARVLFVTHPDVVIDPATPVPEWPLSDVGRRRIEAFAEALRATDIAAVWSSAERKARDGAQILADAFGLSPRVEPALGENGRESTGYIAPPEFEKVVEAFFSNPTTSIRGWETAAHAQGRIVTAVTRIAASAPAHGATVIVSHGGVGRLLMAHLQRVEIGREDRPGNPGGGCLLVIDHDGERLRLGQGWRDIERVADAGL